MDPALHMKARTMAKESVSGLLETISEPKILQGLKEASELLDGDRIFEALKKVRMLLPLEAATALRTQELSKEVA